MPPPDQSPGSQPGVVHCARHGVTEYCILCRHLAEGAGLGYWAIRPGVDGPAQAWCDGCDAILEQEQGWTDRADAEAGWRLSCAVCYDEALARHTLRGWDSGGTPPAGE
jgi:hypothetical protein